MSLIVDIDNLIAESHDPLLSGHETWPRIRLGEAAEILNGFAFQSSLFSRDAGLPLIRIRDLGNNSTSIRFTGAYEDRYLVRKGALLIGMDGEFHVARWTGEPALLNQRVCRVVLDPNAFVQEFVELLLPGYLSAIHAATSSQTVKHLSSRDIQKIPLPRPPLAEQRRIVEKVEMLLMRCAAAERLMVSATVKANAARGLATSKFFQSATDAGLQMADVAEVKLGGTPSRNELNFWNGDVAWVSSGEVANCRIGNTRERITEAGLNASNAKILPPGSVLIAMIGEGKTRGQAAILDITACTNQNVAALICNRAVVDPEYVWRWALANYESTRGEGRGGNQEALNAAKVRALRITVPPLTAQSRIVHQYDAVDFRAASVSRRIDRAKSILSDVRNQVLAKAFAGELVPTEAELARREGRSYEPASVLLDRIRAERASAPAAPKRSRGTTTSASRGARSPRR